MGTTYTRRNCDNCGKQYMADNRNLKRGWGLCCSKSCAAAKREKSKPGYNPERVEANNFRRLTWNLNGFNDSFSGMRHLNSDDEMYGNFSNEE